MKKINQVIVAAMLVSGFCGTAAAEEVACGAKACLTTTDPTTLENKYFVSAQPHHIVRPLPL